MVKDSLDIIIKKFQSNKLSDIRNKRNKAILTNNDIIVFKYTDSLKDDINKLLKINPNYSISFIESSLNEKYDKYEKELKDDICYYNDYRIINISDIRKDVIKEECRDKTLYSTDGSNIFTNHLSIISAMNIDILDIDEIQRRFDINCNVMTARLYNENELDNIIMLID